MKRAIIVLLALGLLLGTAQTVLAQTCDFVLGFATVRSMIPDQVGACIESEWHNSCNGDGIQRTTTGMMVWRKADNWTAFTDGYETYINSPCGLVRRLNDQRFPWEPEIGQPVDCSQAPEPLPAGYVQPPLCVEAPAPAATPVPTAAPSPYKFRYLGAGRPQPNCGSTVVKGVVQDKYGNPVGGVTVRGWWTGGGEGTKNVAYTNGAGEYEHGFAPYFNPGTYVVQVVGVDGDNLIPQSEAASFNITGDCSTQAGWVVDVNFREN